MPKQIKNKKSLNSVEFKSQSRERKVSVAQTRVSGRAGIVPVCIQGRERFGDVTIAASNSFVFSQRYINPGNSEVFPWASKVSVPFEKYKFKVLKLHYIPVVPTTTSGQVSLAIDYNSSDRLPINGEEISQYSRFVTGPVWGKLTLDLLSGRMNRQLFINAATDPTLLPTQVSQLEYFLGKIIVGTESGTAVAVVGRLEIEYVVELLGKNFAGSGFSTQGTSYFGSTPNQEISSGSQLVEFKKSNAVYGSDDGPHLSDTGVITIPPGTWEIDITSNIFNGVDGTLVSVATSFSFAAWLRGYTDSFCNQTLNNYTTDCIRFCMGNTHETALNLVVGYTAPFDGLIKSCSVAVRRLGGYTNYSSLPSDTSATSLSNSRPSIEAKDWVKVDQESKEGRA